MTYPERIMETPMELKLLAASLAVALAVSFAASAQPVPELEFDVVSVKANKNPALQVRNENRVGLLRCKTMHYPRSL